MTHLSLQSVECYNEYSRQWVYSEPMLYSRSCFAAVALDGCIYALGGYGNVHLSSVEKYDPKRGKWSLVPAMSTARNNFGACALHGFIYAVGKSLTFHVPRRASIFLCVYSNQGQSPYVRNATCR